MRVKLGRFENLPHLLPPLTLNVAHNTMGNSKAFRACQAVGGYCRLCRVNQGGELVSMLIAAVGLTRSGVAQINATNSATRSDFTPRNSVWAVELFK